MGMNESAKMQMKLLFSPESVVVYNNNNKKVLWDPVFFFLLPCSSFFPFANSKGKEGGEIGFRYNLVNTQCKEQMGQVVGGLLSLFVVCLFVTSCVLFWKNLD
jgi:hypothetical protein